jgi:hypothetical protein
MEGCAPVRVTNRATVATANRFFHQSAVIPFRRTIKRESSMQTACAGRDGDISQLAGGLTSRSSVAFKADH